MSFLYNFGLSQEDERSEAAALDLSSADHVLSIASAGDMPLSLLALGAATVEAVDIDPAQLHLTRLKLAATRSLPRRDAVAFLGFMPATADDRFDWLQQTLPALPDASRRFWLRQRDAIAKGPVWAGRYEQYVGKLVKVALPVFGRKRFDKLFACGSLQEQREVFDRYFDRKAVRGLFNVGFHPKLFSSRGMDPRSLQHRDQHVSLGDQYFAHFRDLCTATPVNDNHLLQLTLLGRVQSEDVVPTYLTEQGARQIRERSENLRLIQQDLVSYLERVEPAAFDKAHLSNLPDWLDQDAFDRVMQLLVDKCAPGGRAVWRYIHVNRHVPVGLHARIRIDEEKGNKLRRTDRFPFYGIVCAQLDEEVPDSPTTTTRAKAYRPSVAETTGGAADAQEYDFRPVDHEQGGAMLSINRACPIEADFTVVFDRGDDFFRWPDSIYDSYEYMGVYRRDQLVGYCMTGQLEGWTGESYGTYFYGGDARVLAEHRGRRLTELGLRRAVARLPQSVHVGFGLVKRGNMPAQSTMDTGYSDHFAVARVLPFEAVNVLLLRRMRQPRLTVRRARADDVDEMAALFGRANGRRLFAPRVDADSVVKSQTLPGLEPEHWYVVERGGRLAGMAAAWDQHPFHRTLVLRYSPVGAALRTLYAAGRTVLRQAAPLPQEGEALRALTLTRIAVENADPDVLRALVAGIANDHVGRGYHMMHVGFAGDDPLRAATRGLVCQRFRSQIFVVNRRGVPRCAGWFEGAPYVDLAMI